MLEKICAEKEAKIAKGELKRAKNDSYIFPENCEVDEDKLDKYGIEYNIVKTYPNGVRVGNIPKHKQKIKQTVPIWNMKQIGLFLASKIYIFPKSKMKSGRICLKHHLVWSFCC